MKSLFIYIESYIATENNKISHKNLKLLKYFFNENYSI